MTASRWVRVCRAVSRSKPKLPRWPLRGARRPRDVLHGPVRRRTARGRARRSTAFLLAPLSAFSHSALGPPRLLAAPPDSGVCLTRTLGVMSHHNHAATTSLEASASKPMTCSHLAAGASSRSAAVPASAARALPTEIRARAWCGGDGPRPQRPSASTVPCGLCPRHRAPQRRRCSAVHAQQLW